MSRKLNLITATILTRYTSFTLVDMFILQHSGTAIDQVGKNRYIVVVSDSRTSESTGLSLYQLANVMADHGATYTYNLDGGGSSTMVLNGKVINNPVGGSGQSSERAVSDMLYFGYAN